MFIALDLLHPIPSASASHASQLWTCTCSGLEKQENHIGVPVKGHMLTLLSLTWHSVSCFISYHHGTRHNHDLYFTNKALKILIIRLGIIATKHKSELCPKSIYVQLDHGRQ